MLTAEIIKATDNDVLLAMLDRRHPKYAERVDHWDFCDDTYKGGPAWFDQHLFQYFKEGDVEFEDRKARAYRFNHTREVVDLTSKYIFKGEIIRRESDVPEEIKQFWTKATLNGGKIDQLMRVAGERSSRSGRAWIVIDSNKKDVVTTKAEEKASGARAYAYVLNTRDVLDYAFDDNGDLLWLLHEINVRDDDDPINASGKVDVQYRLWTRQSWFTFKKDDQGDKRRKPLVKLENYGDHGLGLVPLVGVNHVPSSDPWDCPGLVDDIVYLDRAVANYLSNLDAIIQDQTFSQLVIPAQSLPPGEEQSSIQEMGTKRIFAYNAEGNAAPQYISPDPKQAAMILAVINKVIAEIYHTVGLAGERTKQDNAVGIDNSSGVAKAYDFERVNSMLVSKASTLEQAENRIVDIVAAWTGATLEEGVQPVTYPKNFDVRSLYDEFQIAEKLFAFEGPKGIRREQMKTLLEKLLPRLSSERVKKLVNEIDQEWLEVDPLLLAAQTAPRPALSPGQPPATPSPKAPKERRQGQVTKETT